MPFIPRALVASGLLAFTLGVAACGSSGDSTTADSTTADSSAAPAAASTASSSGSSDSAAAPAAKLSANTATKAELETIPGVGPEIADEILEYRPYDAQTGPDRFRDELGKYIDDAEIERIMTYLDFGA